jgi:hypothetical protein
MEQLLSGETYTMRVGADLYLNQYLWRPPK